MVKDNGERYEYFFAEHNEPKNKNQQQENAVNENDPAHEGKVQDDPQKNSALQIEEDNPDKPGQVSGEQNLRLPAPKFSLNARVNLKEKH
jgi:hypothetical protein